MKQLETDPVLKEWYDSRPKIIQQLYEKCPFGEYIISNDAPYALTCPGTTVEVIGYRITGEIIVKLLRENMLPEALKHEAELIEKYQTPKENIETIITADGMKTVVEPEHLIPKKKDRPDTTLPLSNRSNVKI
ncbi:hypothetical protein [Aquimarina algiphila]|uniref:Uncharacterized protein n=1 Tax=Aquimarina algiphila TaxID=2047982 RepID=A0A554VRN1_9FLAO|nr:hypothetical protein [Aquimarina algiphila]TSE11309.1 hypothetical protein FOF46_01375 [Aquimarina algiphila]